MNPIFSAARAAMKPTEPGPPWKWIEANVAIKNSPFGNRPNFSLTPWLKEPSECFADNRRHVITLQCCVQGAKSFFLQTHGIWALDQQPGPLGYYVQTNEFVGKIARGRWIPMVRGCPPLFARLRAGDRFSLGKAEIYFDHTFAFFMAANLSNAQSHSLRYVFCDDVFCWDAGVMSECHKRATQWWNRRIVNASTPGEANSDMDLEYLAGDQREWQMACPKCGRRQTPDFEKHIRWPTDERTKPDDKWNFEAVKKAARFVCEFCQSSFPHTEQIARCMNDAGGYCAMNPSAPYDRISFRWNALCLSPSVLSWGDLAVEFIQAARAWKAGLHEPMKEFKTKRLALTWNPREINPYADLPVIEIEPSAAPAGSRYPVIHWPQQDSILLGVDVQLDHFWLLVMAWSVAGECALFAKKAFGWQEIEAIQSEYGIAPEDVTVDWSHRPQEVVRECSRRGEIVWTNGKPRWTCWQALRGSDNFQFTWTNPKTKIVVPLPYSWPPMTGNPTSGLHRDDPRLKEFLAPVELPDKRKGFLRKECRIVTWSNPSIKDIVIARRDGKTDAIVETLKGLWNAEYFRQQHSQKKVQVKGKYGSARWRYENFTDDHLFDCRCMITVRAIQRGYIMDVLANVETEA